MSKRLVKYCFIGGVSSAFIVSIVAYIEPIIAGKDPERYFPIFSLTVLLSPILSGLVGYEIASLLRERRDTSLKSHPIWKLSIFLGLFFPLTQTLLALIKNIESIRLLNIFTALGDTFGFLAIAALYSPLIVCLPAAIGAHLALKGK